jgi:hypothetical protein
MQYPVEDRQCWIRIDSMVAQTATASWFQLWEGMVALNSMCARRGMKGIASRLGRVPIIHLKPGIEMHFR